MSEKDSEMFSAWSFPLVGCEKEYRLTAKLYSSKLVIEDKRGNKIEVNKRSRALVIERKGKVEWLGE